MTYKKPLVGSSTHKGPKKVNEDSIYSFFDDHYPIGFSVIADGMGGHAQGKRASSITIRKLKYWWNYSIAKMNFKKLNLNNISQQLDGVFYLVNEELLKIKHEENLNVGTTCSMIFFLNGNYLIKHVGDSRIYFLKDFNQSTSENLMMPNPNTSQMTQLTKDDSWVQLQIDNNLLTYEQARTHLKRNILTQCLGIEKNLDIHTYKGKYNNNDYFVLATDGLYNAMTYEELFSNLKLMPENLIQTLCEVFLLATIQYYEVQDNISFILCEAPPIISKTNLLINLFNKRN